MGTFNNSDWAVVYPSLGCWIISSETALGDIHLGSPCSGWEEESWNNKADKFIFILFPLLIYLLPCDGVEGLDILIVEEGGDEVDDVLLQEILCSPTQDRVACLLFL